jgi:GT2 family glycosyltransferase
MKPIAQIFRRVFTALSEGGVSELMRRAKNFRHIRRGKKITARWLIENDTLAPAQIEKIKEQIDALPHKPLISIVMPVYDVDEKWLRLCIGSVTAQLYSHWELCIADDASPKPHIRKALEEFAAKDSRIKIVFRKKNGHISAASNSALEIATGEFTVLLDHDDELTPDALYCVAAELNTYPEAQMIYSDEDLIDERGRRSEPKFKPDFSPDLFYSLNLITHLSAYRTDLLKKIGGFRLGFEGSQDYDLALRVIENIGEDQIRHIPKILYHWRAISGSVALDANEKPYAHERARAAIREHFERTGVSAEVMQGYNTLHRVRYDLPANIKISVITNADIQLPGNFEVMRTEVTGSSAARFNAAAKKASGDILIFLEDDIEPKSDDWWRELAGQLTQEKIGVAGARIDYSNKLVHHAGIIPGINGSVGFAHRGMPVRTPGNMLRVQVVSNFSAVSGACLATRRDVFESVAGFDEANFPDGLYDVDYCLRLREKGLRIVMTPYANLVMDAQSNTEKTIEHPDAAELKCFKQKWAGVIERDPYYNPNLTRNKEDFSVK